MHYRKPTNMMYNQETRLALLEMSMAHISNSLNQMRKEAKENNKSIREELNHIREELKESNKYLREEAKENNHSIREELKEIRKEASSNFKLVIGIIVGSQIFGLVMTAIGKAYGII